jgi:chromosome partition protein MukE
LPKRNRKDERLAQKLVRAKLAETIRRLGTLGFVEAAGDDQLLLRPALLRFAEPVRDLAEPGAALAQLVAQGEVALAEPEPGAEGELDAEPEPEDESEGEGDGGEGVA